MSRATHWIFLIAAVVLLAGCSVVRLGYTHLDIIAAWTTDEYFDLDSRQKEEFSKRFDRLHEWHRYEQLPDYAALLSQIRAKIGKGLAREDVVSFVEGFRARYRTLAARGADDAAALLQTITPAQLETLQRQWDRNNRKFMREYQLSGSAEDIRRARVRRTLDQVQDWVGSLNPEQEQRLAALVNALPMTEKLRHEDRLRRQREFLELMAQRGNREEFATKLRRWLLNWEDGRSPEYQRQFTEWLDKRVQMVVELDRMLTPRQRAAAQQRLQGYVDDFTRLAERRRAQTAAQ